MTAKTKHTPRPWAYDAERGEIYADDGDVCPLIATVNLDSVNHDQALADGLVLTAAPDLLAALKESRDAVAWLGERNGEANTPLLALVDAAIAKAEGH